MINLTARETHLRDYLRVILKRKKIALTFFATTIVVVVIATLGSTPQYTATTSLKIEKKGGDPIRDVYQYIRSDPEFLESQVKIISSHAVMGRVVSHLDLTKNYQLFFPKEEEAFSLTRLIGRILSRLKKAASDQATAESLPEELRQQEMSPTEKLAGSLLQSLKITQQRGSGILEISFTSQHSKFSALICNTIPRAYIERLLEMKTTNTEYMLDWMNKRAAIERENLEASENNLQEYLKAQNIVTIEDRIAIIPERMSQINRDLTSTESRKKELATIVAQIEQTATAKLDSIPAIANSSSLQSIRSQILDEEQESMKLSQKYGDKHPVRIQAWKNIEELKNKKIAEINTIVQTIRNEYQLAISNEQNLIDQLEGIKQEAARLNEKFVQYNILKREIETKRQLYEDLIARIKEQTMTKQTRDVDVFVVGEAFVPESPSNRNLPRNLMLAVIFGLLGGIGCTLFLEYLDNTITFCEDAEEKTGIPAIASIHLINGKIKRPETIVADSPGSAEAEAFKSLRTSLALSTEKGFPKSLMITSVSPGEGKTLTSVNLAIAVTQTERTVLIVDGDMRRPKVHLVFGLKGQPGLSEILTRSVDPADAIQPSGIAGLDILAAGAIPPNPSELLSSERAHQVFEELAPDYDMIIIDSPPIGAVSDGIIITAYAEKIILITRSGVTRYEDVIRYMQRFKDADKKIIGQVVNAIDLQKEGYYYSSYRRSGYYTTS